MDKKKKINQTYIISLLIVFAVVIWGMVSPSSFEALANSALSVISTNFGWVYVLVMTSFVLFCIWIGFISKYKDMRLQDLSIVILLGLQCYSLLEWELG